ncbi:MAG: HD domain-containing phosphohydrolase [Solirubrobacteraceae bacterium]
MLVATTCVLLLPAGLVWMLHSRGVITSFWVGLLIGLALTLVVLTIGTGYWRRRRHPATVLFSELLVWGWVRHQYLDHKLNAALHALAELHPDDSARRTQLLTEIAAAVEAKDPFLYGHSRRVARYVTRVARRMHLDRSEAARVRTAALLHDVGKLHTPPEVLLLPRRLDAEETAVMRRHAEDGAEIVAALGDRSLASVVRHHHERFDGTGYPTGLEGDAIPLGSRIIAVPDTFDAITMTRPYRPGLPHGDALAVLREEGGRQFDPDVVRAFLAEYTDRGGAMIWAAAEQLIPVLRVGAVAAGAIALSAAAFAAGKPSAHTPPRGQTAAAANFHQPPTGPGPTQSRVAPRPQVRPEHTQSPPTGAARPGQTQPPALGTSATTPTPSPVALASFPAQSFLRSRRPSQVPGTVAPAAPPSSAQTRPRALPPKAVATYSRLGSSFTDPRKLTALITPPQAEPRPAPPTGTTTPTPPAAPPTPSPPAPPKPTSPAPPAQPTTPTPPSNPDQCKDGGWQTLGYENQGQCIAAANNG